MSARVHSKQWDEEEKEEEPVVSATQAVLGYHPKRQGFPIPNHSFRKQLVQHIYDEYIVPEDFESNLRKFGPLSGLTFEERLISSFEWRLLQPKHGQQQSRGDDWKFCWRCGARGDHLAREGCPVREKEV